MKQYNAYYRQKKYGKSFTQIFTDIMTKNYKTSSWLKDNVFELTDEQSKWVDNYLKK
jgi:hypothetical protein